MLERSLEEQPAYSGRSGRGPAIGRFSRDSKGSIAILFALMLLPAALLMGLVIDLTETLSTRTRFQMAADAALLAAMATEDKASREKVGADVFRANLSKADQQKMLDVKFHPGGSGTAGRVDYVFKEDLMLAKMHRVAEWIVNGSSIAEGGLGSLEKYPFDIEFWLDVSASMAIGIDERARARLKELSRFDHCNKSCIFACHVEKGSRGCNRILNYSVNGAQKRGTTYDRARENGVPLRFDVMKDAVRDISSSLLDNGMAREMNIGIFAREFRYVRERIRSESEVDLALQAVYFQMDIPKDRIWDGKGSFLNEALQRGAMTVRPPSRVQHGQNINKIVIIITDGMQYRYGKSPQGPIDASVCRSIKQKGIHVAVIEMPYVDPFSDPATLEAFHYEKLSTDLRPVRRALEACASPGFFFMADDRAGIQSAFDGIVQRAAETKPPPPIRLR